MSTKKLVILGAGGMGREVLFQLLDMNSGNKYYDILGFIDNTPGLQGKSVNNFPILGTDRWLINYCDEINVVIGIGNPIIRRQVFEKFSSQGNIFFPSIIADGVKYSESVTIGSGCIIGFYSVLTVDISIGDFVIILRHCSIGHDVTIGDFVTVYPNVTISGNVLIGGGVEVGTGVNIIQNKSVGDNSVIGAGAAVIRDIPANCTVVGVPAWPIPPPPPPDYFMR
jgi:sugar O-acyltransferase (sialic acid O-acetyltransferase NeuD family)